MLGWSGSNSVKERLEGGSVVAIDYEDTARSLLPRRQHGTLRTHRVQVAQR